MYLINGNFLLQYTIYILYIVSCSCTTSCIDNLSKTNCFVFSRKRVQNYCFFATWPNFLEDFLNYLRNSLIFSTHFFEQSAAVFQYLTEHTLPSFRKRVQKYCFFMTWTNFYAKFLYFLRNALILKKYVVQHKFWQWYTRWTGDSKLSYFATSRLSETSKVKRRMSEGWAKGERRASEGRAVVNTTKMCIRNNCIAKN